MHSTNATIPKQMRREHPYRALAAGVVVRGIRDLDGKKAQAREARCDKSVDWAKLSDWIQRAGWSPQRFKRLLQRDSNENDRSDE